MKRDILNSPRIKEIQKKRRKILFRKFLLLCVALILLFGIFTYVSSLARLNVSSVEVVGNKITDSEEIKTVINEKLTGKYLYLFKRSNIFFYPSKEIKLALGENFKRLVNINLSIKDGNVLEVSTEERKGEYVWCGDTFPTPEISSVETCYFMDNSGYIFDEAPYFSGDVYFKFYGKLSDNPNPIGMHFDGEFSNLLVLKDMLTSIKIEPIALEKTGEDLKVYLASKSSGNSPHVLVRLGSDYQKIVENLQAALETEPLVSDFKNKYSTLLYLDLRFGNKVYFKFRP